MNDELWNLMPMDSSLNSSKSNRLPKWDPFFIRFAKNQFIMYQLIHEKEGIRKLKSLAVELGQKPFRGKQLFEWIHRKQIRSIDEMTNLPASFRDLLKEKYLVSGVEELEKQVSKKGDTAKYLFALPDGNVIGDTNPYSDEEEKKEREGKETRYKVER